MIVFYNIEKYFVVLFLFLIDIYSMIKERIIYKKCATLFCKIDVQMIFLQISVWFSKFKKKIVRKFPLRIIVENIIYKYINIDSFGIKIGLILEVKLTELVYKNVSWSLFIKLRLMRFKFALGEERWRQSDFTLRCSLNILTEEFFIRDREVYKIEIFIIFSLLNRFLYIYIKINKKLQNFLEYLIITRFKE